MQIHQGDPAIALVLSATLLQGTCLPRPPDGERVTEISRAAEAGIALNVDEQGLTIRTVGCTSPFAIVE